MSHDPNNPNYVDPTVRQAMHRTQEASMNTVQTQQQLRDKLHQDKMKVMAILDDQTTRGLVANSKPLQETAVPAENPLYGGAKGDQFKWHRGFAQALPDMVNQAANRIVQDSYYGNGQNPATLYTQHGQPMQPTQPINPNHQLQFENGQYYQQQPTQQPYAQQPPQHTPRVNMNPVMHGGFQPIMFMKESSNGKDLTRYAIQGPRGRIGRDYRHYEVAAMVSAALNETGGMTDDRRIQRINALCEQEDALIREINRAKKQLAGVPRGNVKKAEILENKIDELKYQASAIRNQLGIR